VYSSRHGSPDTEHIGSAHGDAELETLKAAARQRMATRYRELDVGPPGGPGDPRPPDPAVIIGSAMVCTGRRSWTEDVSSGGGLQTARSSMVGRGQDWGGSARRDSDLMGGRTLRVLRSSAIARRPQLHSRREPPHEATRLHEADSVFGRYDRIWSGYRRA
jgi:hypothetical protein